MNMSTEERIREQVAHLSESARRTVLDFVEQLAQRLRQEDLDWSAGSLSAALAGTEDDEWPEYGEADFKEKWR
ncbi:MAG: hypothetical protein HOP18_12050 [Deltaproteobacteria bacterium]|nr:hypothetical protein [Deltaproteobacteria bacterium]